MQVDVLKQTNLGSLLSNKYILSARLSWHFMEHSFANLTKMQVARDSLSDPNTETNTDSNGCDIEKEVVHISDEAASPGALIKEQGLNGSHTLDAHQLHDSNVKTTADGNIVLITQPSSDPNDPLN